jgi:hypothetical protein
MTRNIPADADVLCDEATVLGPALRGKPSSIRYRTKIKRAEVKCNIWPVIVFNALN